MATKAPVTAEQYLHMTFEYDAEFVYGEIVERAMPDRLHSKIQLRLQNASSPALPDYPLELTPALLFSDL